MTRRGVPAVGLGAAVGLVTLAGCAGDPRESAVSPSPTTALVSVVDTTSDPPPQPPSPSPATVPFPTVVLARTGLPLVYEPSSPRELALTIAAAHRRISRGGADVAVAGRDLQRALRAVTRETSWLDVVDQEMPADVVEAWRHDLAIQRALRATPSRPRSERPATLPAWTVRAPQPPAVLRAHYDEAAALTGIGWEWLAAINLVETRMGRIVGSSSAGAEGPMQFLPTTWASCCNGNVWDDRDAIIGAATYLQHSGGPADMRAAVLQYNPNDLYLAMVTAYADAMRADPRAYEGFHAYEVIVPTSAGDVRLAEGYHAAEPVDAAAYLAANPEHLASVPGS